jgi:hypothetical protein
MKVLGIDAYLHGKRVKKKRKSGNDQSLYGGGEFYSPPLGNFSHVSTIDPMPDKCALNLNVKYAGVGASMAGTRACRRVHFAHAEG